MWIVHDPDNKSPQLENFLSINLVLMRITGIALVGRFVILFYGYWQNNSFNSYVGMKMTQENALKHFLYHVNTSLELTKTTVIVMSYAEYNFLMQICKSTGLFMS